MLADPTFLPPHEQDRRAPDAPLDRRKIDLRHGLLLAALLAFLAWAAKPLVPVSAVRFEADSISRDRDNARRDSLLGRIDSRVGSIYCSSLPKDRQAGCR